MIEEPKQDLLVQYLLNELEAQRPRRESALSSNLTPNSGILCGKRRMRLPRSPTQRLPMTPPAALPQRILELERNTSPGTRD